MSAGATSGWSGTELRNSRLSTIKRSFIGHRLSRIFQKIFEFRSCREGGPRAQRTALHRRHGVRKPQTRFEIFARQKTVEKAAVKRVARTGRVAATTRRDVAGGFNELACAIDHRACRT